MRVGINGFGRIGRTLARLLWLRGHDLVHVNDLNPDPANLAYLLRNDSVHGRFPADLAAEKGRLRMEGGGRHWDVGLSARPDTLEAPWAESGAELVVEATGTDANHAACRGYLGGTTRWAVITHTAVEADLTLVSGVNDRTTDPFAAQVISTSICDACAMAPILRVLSDRVGVEQVWLTTLHPWLSYQNLVDGPVRSRARPSDFIHDFALGRASVGSIIPKATTAGAAIMDLVPALRGRIASQSYRVPTAAVCYGQLSALLAEETGAGEILEVLREELGPILRFTDEPMVSTDLIGEAASAVVDSRWLTVERGRYLSLSAGYDNEWGYSSRVADLIGRLASAGLRPD